MINTYAQDLGIHSRELARVGFVRWDLARSDGCPCQGEKHQHDIFAKVIAELYVFIQMGWQCKIRGCLPDIKFHFRLLSGVQFYPRINRKRGSRATPWDEMD